MQGKCFQLPFVSSNIFSNVIRFLPPALNQVLVAYLTMVLPFRILVTKKTSIKVPFSFLFSTNYKVWDTRKFSSILVQYTRIYKIPQLEMAIYRQIAVGIAKRHLLGQGLKLDLDGEEEINVDLEEEATHRQASHSVRTGNLSYFQTHDSLGSDAALHEFRKVSVAWQQLLHLRTKEESTQFKYNFGTDMDSIIRRMRAAYIDRGCSPINDLEYKNIPSEPHSSYQEMDLGAGKNTNI